MTIIRRELRWWLAGPRRGQGAAWLTDSPAASQGWFRLPSTQAHLSPEMELPDTLALSKSPAKSSQFSLTRPTLSGPCS